MKRITNKIQNDYICDYDGINIRNDAVDNNNDSDNEDDEVTG